MTNKKSTIIRATIERLIGEGTSFSTEDVAKDVGCSQSLIFRYYGTKEGLISACFDEICREIRIELEKVPFPKVIDSGNIQDYMMDVWETYFNYLRSNRSHARVYVACVSQGYRYPAGYDSPEAVLRRILDEHYDVVILKYPNTKLIAEYLILVANSVAIGLSSGWGNEVENLNEVVKQLIMNGIMSQCHGTDDNYENEARTG